MVMAIKRQIQSNQTQITPQFNPNQDMKIAGATSAWGEAGGGDKGLPIPFMPSNEPYSKDSTVTIFGRTYPIDGSTLQKIYNDNPFPMPSFLQPRPITTTKKPASALTIEQVRARNTAVSQKSSTATLEEAIAQINAAIKRREGNGASMNSPSAQKALVQLRQKLKQFKQDLAEAKARKSSGAASAQPMQTTFGKPSGRAGVKRNRKQHPNSPHGKKPEGDGKVVVAKTEQQKAEEFRAGRDQRTQKRKDFASSKKEQGLLKAKQEMLSLSIKDNLRIVENQVGRDYVKSVDCAAIEEIKTEIKNGTMTLEQQQTAIQRLKQLADKMHDAYKNNYYEPTEAPYKKW